jgi:predicted phosphodiesterase
MMILSDIHLLGKRRRKEIERKWVDWQIYMSFKASMEVHRPDVVLILGDQFDEGGFPTTQEDWDIYSNRFFSIVKRFPNVEFFYAVGNHDTSFGKYLNEASLRRHEITFGPANRFAEVQGYRFVQLNTMALDHDVQEINVQQKARAFLDEIAPRLKGGVHFLISHFPLYRPNDLDCGERRQREEGHVTYEHPSFSYETHHHVLSEKLSIEILSKFKPQVIFSGHTHAWCDYSHKHPTGAREYTVPTFSWGMRPDPGFVLASVKNRDVQVTLCNLPREDQVFMTYAATLLYLFLSILYHTYISRQTLPQKLRKTN